MTKTQELEARIAELEAAAAKNKDTHEAIQRRVDVAKKYITSTMWMLDSVLDGFQPDDENWAWVARDMLKTMAAVHSVEVLLRNIEGE